MTNAELESLLASERIARVEAERWAAEWRLSFDQECRIYDEACAKLEALEGLTYKWRSLAMRAEEAPVEGDESAKRLYDCAAEVDAALGAEPGDAALTQKEGQGAPAARSASRCAFPFCADPAKRECAHCGDPLCVVHIERESQCIYAPGNVAGPREAQQGPAPSGAISPSISGIAADKGEGRG